MAVFTLASATGAPGVTTCALGLALAWPRDVVLVDADRCVSQALVAGYFGGLQTGGRGLTSVAQSYRDGLDLADDLPSHFVAFPTNGKTPPGSIQRWFVPGFARPGSAQLFEPVWPELAPALAELDRLGIDVIVDAGRWGPQGTPPDLMANTRCLALVTRPQLRALAGLRLYLPDARAAIESVTGCSIGLFVIGGGDPYDGAEIGTQFGLPIWGDLPWQPADAAALSDGAPTRRKASNRPLARAFEDTAATLRDLAGRWDARVKRNTSPEWGLAHV